jgi:phage terminase small subunit
VPLNDRQQRFVQEYLIDLNATQAAIRAGYAKKTAEQAASRLLRNVKVQEAIQEAKKKRSVRTEVTADKVLDRLWAIATADPNELIEHRRVCCQRCYGEEPHDERRGPNPQCMTCFGDGVGKVIAKDTRNLSSAALCLYAGVKLTKQGLEVQMHDQRAALVDVARHLGMFVEKKELSGPNGGPISHDHTGSIQTTLTPADVDAARRLLGMADRDVQPDGGSKPVDPVHPG